MKLANFDSTQTNLLFLKQTFKPIFRARKNEQSNSQITSMLHCPLFTHWIKCGRRSSLSDLLWKTRQFNTQTNGQWKPYFNDEAEQIAKIYSSWQLSEISSETPTHQALYAHTHTLTREHKRTTFQRTKIMRRVIS